MAVNLLLNGDLCRFLPKGRRETVIPALELARRTSIKDFLEALGIPHPEIHRLLVNGTEKNFNHIVAKNDRIEVFAVPWPVDLTEHNHLTPALHPIRFAVDANVGKLARLLRMTGFDTFYEPGLADGKLAETAWRDKRILLTRDIALLKRKVVVHGRLIRHSNPAAQLREVIGLYGLRERIRPFSRCLCCNGVLEEIAKAEIIDRLQPLTRKYYDDFMICPQCERLYWPGSHRQRMLKLIEEL
ncbi:MAG: Mut7-C RNAse domain-containing protein [Thermodesulfobacteriota bacterium]